MVWTGIGHGLDTGGKGVKKTRLGLRFPALGEEMAPRRTQCVGALFSAKRDAIWFCKMVQGPPRHTSACELGWLQNHLGEASLSFWLAKKEFFLTFIGGDTECQKMTDTELRNTPRSQVVPILSMILGNQRTLLGSSWEGKSSIWLSRRRYNQSLTIWKPGLKSLPVYKTVQTISKEESSLFSTLSTRRKERLARLPCRHDQTTMERLLELYFVCPCGRTGKSRTVTQTEGSLYLSQGE